MAKYCAKCGALAQDDAAFCPSCGSPFGQTPVQQPPTQAAYDRKLLNDLAKSGLGKEKIDELSKVGFVGCQIRGPVPARQKAGIVVAFILLWFLAYIFLRTGITYGDGTSSGLGIILFIAPPLMTWAVVRWRGCHLSEAQVEGKVVAVSPIFRRYTGGQQAAFAFLGIVGLVLGRFAGAAAASDPSSGLAILVVVFLFFILISVALARRWRPSSVRLFASSSVKFTGDQIRIESTEYGHDYGKVWRLRFISPQDAERIRPILSGAKLS